MNKLFVQRVQFADNGINHSKFKVWFVTASSVMVNLRAKYKLLKVNVSKQNPKTDTKFLFPWSKKFTVALESVAKHAGLIIVLIIEV